MTTVLVIPLPLSGSQIACGHLRRSDHTSYNVTCLLLRSVSKAPDHEIDAKVTSLIESHPVIPRIGGNATTVTALRSRTCSSQVQTHEAHAWSQTSSSTTASVSG